MKIIRVFGGCIATLCVFDATASPQVFFGNLHSHTSYSDGSGTPRQAFKHARDKAGVDFLAVTEHNHANAEFGAKERRDGVLIAKDPSLYNGSDPESLISAAREFTNNGKFVALYGQEFSTIDKGNHVNVFEVDEVIPVTSGLFKAFTLWLDKHPDSQGKAAVVQMNHPSIDSSPPEKEYGRDDFGSYGNWVAAMDARVELIEVLNGPSTARTSGNRPNETMEKDFLEYLDYGFHIAPTADQDNHYYTWGDATDARTGIIAAKLTKADILDAMRKRHVYATQDKNLRLIGKANGKLFGEILDAPDQKEPLDVELSIRDDDEPDAEYTIAVFFGSPGKGPAEIVAQYEASGNGTITLPDLTISEKNQFMFLRVTQDGDKDKAWLAPVWFE